MARVLSIWGSSENIIRRVKNVTFIRAAYRLRSTPEMLIPETKMRVDVNLREGETVMDVINYHYGARASDVRIGGKEYDH